MEKTKPHKSNIGSNHQSLRYAYQIFTSAYALKEEIMENQLENVLQRMDRWSDRFYKLKLELLELEKEFSHIESELVAIQKTMEAKP